MLEQYVGALWEEIGAWDDLHQGLREQRVAIVQRDIEGVWASQDRLPELLGLVAGCHQRGAALRPATVDDSVARVEQQAQALGDEARAALRLNHELLRDICSYLDMLRDVAYPHTQPPTYRRPSQTSHPENAPVHSVSRIA